MQVHHHTWTLGHLDMHTIPPTTTVVSENPISCLPLLRCFSFLRYYFASNLPAVLLDSRAVEVCRIIQVKRLQRAPDTAKSEVNHYCGSAGTECTAYHRTSPQQNIPKTATEVLQDPVYPLSVEHRSVVVPHTAREDKTEAIHKGGAGYTRGQAERKCHTGCCGRGNLQKESQSKPKPLELVPTDGQHFRSRLAFGYFRGEYAGCGELDG